MKREVSLIAALMLFFLALFSAPVATNAQVLGRRNKIDDKSRVELRERAQRVDEYLVASGMTGGILVAKDGEVILSKGYGWADATRKILLTSRSVFDIGSVTKQFTAAAILKLEEQGKLKVTDPITRFFQDVPEDKREITIHHLLTHTAGFEHDVQTAKFPSRDVWVRAAFDTKLKLKPGEKFSYSNVGYSLLAVIIELASGTAYESYLHKQLWEPAGMSKTGNLIPRFSPDELVRGYDNLGDLGISQDKWWDADGPFWGGRGAGYVLSTLEDLHKWDIALTGDKILSPGSKQKLHTPVAPFTDRKESRTQTESWAYGYGWAVYKTPRGTRLIEHTGGNSIVSTDMLRYVDEGVSIIFFTSERGTMSLPTLQSIVYSGLNAASAAIPPAFIGSALPEFPRRKTALNPGELQKFAGTYELPSGDRFVLEVDRDTLQVNSLAWGVGGLLTTFPALPDTEGLSGLGPQTAGIMENIAKGDLTPIKDQIVLEGTLSEEQAYWKRTFAGWNERLGAFKRSQVIGTSLEQGLLNIRVLVQFDRGTVPVQFRRDNSGKFYIGTATLLLPRYYRFIPQSRTEFVVFNHKLQTSTPITFTLGSKGTPTGFLVSRGKEQVQVKKIAGQ